jgi:hypothetical protein
MAADLFVLPQACLNQQDLRWHRCGFVRLRNSVVTRLAIPLQIARR